MTIEELQLGPLCNALTPEDVEIAAANALAEMITIEAHDEEIDAWQESEEKLTGELEEARDELAGEKCITRVLRRVHKVAKDLQAAKASDDCVDPALWTELDHALQACRFVKGVEPEAEKTT